MLHVCFSLSGAGIVRRVLRAAGHRENVLDFHDDLSFGPIYDVTGEARRTWFETLYADRGVPADQLWPLVCDFWRTVDNLPDSLTIWYTRRSTLEYCAFLELLNRLAPSTGLSVIDFTEKIFPSSAGDYRAFGTGILNEEMMALGLDILQETTVGSFSSGLQHWRALKSESSAVRTLIEGRLVSVGEDFYDWMILARVMPDWRKYLRIAGDVLADHTMEDDTCLFGFDWIRDRIQLLARQGALQVRGGPEYKSMEVRLNPSRA